MFKYDQLEAENRELRAKLKEIDDLAGTDLICRDCGREIDFYDAKGAAPTLLPVLATAHRATGALAHRPHAMPEEWVFNVNQNCSTLYDGE